MSWKKGLGLVIFIMLFTNLQASLDFETNQRKKRPHPPILMLEEQIKPPLISKRKTLKLTFHISDWMETQLLKLEIQVNQMFKDYECENNGVTTETEKILVPTEFSLPRIY
jgi:hypothetical protein